MKKLLNKLIEMLSHYSVQQEDVVGVDITPGAVRVAQLEKNNEGWFLSKLSYKYIDLDGQNTGVINSADVYIDKLRTAIQSAKITTTNAAVSIPVSSAIVKVVSLPLMTDDELNEAVETDSLWENVIQLTDTLEDYSVFWQVIRRNETENVMDLLFVASKLEDINFYLDLVRKSGLNPVIVDVRCFAMKNAIEVNPKATERGKTIALLEIGAYENYILILRDDSPFISSVFVTDSDKRSMADPLLSEDEARKITDRLAMQVKQTVTTYEAKFKGIPVEELLLVSSSSYADTLFKALQQSLNPMPVKIFNAVKPIKIPEQLKEKVKAEPNQSVFATALGLATRKLDVFGYYQYVTGVNNINLLPNREQVRNVEKAKFLSKFGLILGGLFIALTIAYTFYNQYSSESETSGEVMVYEELFIKKMELENQIENLKLEQSHLAGMLIAAEGLDSNQHEMYELLTQITMSFPEGVWLESISYSGSQILTLEGRSVSDQNILEFINRLNSSERVLSASLKTMTIAKQAGRDIKKFSLSAKVDVPIFEYAILDGEN